MSKEQLPVAGAPATPAAQLRQAAAMHQQGQLAHADALYAEFLLQQPGHVDALHLAGICALQQGHAARAVDFLERTVALETGNPSVYSNLGLALQSVGRRDEAAAQYEHALRLDPEHVDAWYNLGNLRQELQRHEAALNCYDSVLGRHPGHVDALLNRGNALRRLGRRDEALLSYAQALAIRPAYPPLLHHRGDVLCDLGRYEEAMASYDAALVVQPRFAAALSQRGRALRALGRHHEALASYDRALELEPRHAGLLASRAHILRDLGLHREALASYELALAALPDYPEAWLYRGATLMDLGRYREAQASYAGALAIRPDYPEARWNDALCRLLLGDFEAGWRQYEARWDSPRLNVPRRSFPQAPWLGDIDLQGKRLLIHAEQGFGDTLQFCRYVAWLAGQAAEIIVEVQPELKTLLRSLAGVDQLLAQGEALPPFDVQIPMLSLPLACRTTLHSIPSAVPYLSADTARVEYWRSWLGGDVSSGMRAQPCVGLAWRGSGVLDRDPRSLPFSALAGLLDTPARFVSLHRDTHADDAAALADCAALKSVASQLKDFAETAALITSLDLVITIDTAVAHLAGALGKPVWVLLSFNADWRWLTERTDSPWYPTARLFRQPAPGDWHSVIAAVADALPEFLRRA